MSGVNLTRVEAAERSAHLAIDTYRLHLDVTTGREHFIAKTDAWLAANKSAPAAMIRFLNENRDHLARALRAQAKDAN